MQHKASDQDASSDKHCLSDVLVSSSQIIFDTHISTTNRIITFHTKLTSEDNPILSGGLENQMPVSSQKLARGRLLIDAICLHREKSMNFLV